jgi:hypothetical protein
VRRFFVLAVVVGSVTIALGGPAVASTGTGAAVAQPSKSAKMVCATEAQEDIAGTLRVKPTTVTTPTWNNSVYSCQYVYPNGPVTLSVKELRNGAATGRYFEKLGKTLDRRPGKVALGGDAFTARDGSVVVRKDFKVLDVDISQLTGKLGTPPMDPPIIALNIAATVMGCWTGT